MWQDCGLTRHNLDESHQFYSGKLPAELLFDQASFESLWQLHPDEFHDITIHGRQVKTPRWQQAFGADYYYTGTLNRALPIPDLMRGLYDWCRQAIHRELNAILLNWYDAEFRHYIGKHRDSTVNMLVGSPIVTISLGATRTFRLRPWRSKRERLEKSDDQSEAAFIDFPAEDGTIFVTPYETNLAWTHDVPHSARCDGRRISFRLRAFTTGVLEDPVEDSSEQSPQQNNQE